MNEDDNIEPIEMSPTRAELIARVRSRGRQIRARRRLTVAGLTALVVLAIAAPAIAIGARATSHGVSPATGTPRHGDFRVAPVERTSAPPCELGTLVLPNPAAANTTTTTGGRSSGAKDLALVEKDSLCITVGRSIMHASDVVNASVVYDQTQGWIINLTVKSAAIVRLRTLVGRQAAIIVGGKVASAPTVNPGITGTVVTISPELTRAQAIALATKILGHAPSQVASPPELTATLKLPSTTLVSGATMQATLVIVNHTTRSITLRAGSGCPATWQLETRAIGGTSVSVGTMQLGPPDCPAATPLAPGTNRLTLSLTAISKLCYPKDPKLPGEPACLPNGNPPPLAAGEYTVQASADTIGAPVPAPVSLRVVAAAAPR